MRGRGGLFFWLPAERLWPVEIRHKVVVCSEDFGLDEKILESKLFGFQDDGLILVRG
jgi:hypothetical protein